MKEAIFGFILSGWGSTIIISALGAFGYKKYRAFAKELMDVPAKWIAINSKKSAGGEDITKEEMGEFIKEIVDVIQHIPFIYKKKG